MTTTDVLALDIATSIGWARGRVGEQPCSGSWRFETYKDLKAPAVFGNAIAWFSKFLEPMPRPDVLIIEDMLPIMKNRAVRDRLGGLHGIMQGVGSLRGVPEIALVSVGDVRAHFIQNRNASRERAKADTMARCQRLGWQFDGDDAADALAVWSYACALIDPKLALNVVPLFNPKLLYA